MTCNNAKSAIECFKKITGADTVWITQDFKDKTKNVIKFNFNNNDKQLQFTNKITQITYDKKANTFTAGEGKINYIMNNKSWGVYKSFFDAMKNEFAKSNECAKLYDIHTICFYDMKDPYYEFTNFFDAKITINGTEYKTTEHYFQANKYIIGSDDYKNVKDKPTCRDAFDYAQAHGMKWENSQWRGNYQMIIMWTALVAKFTQHENLRKMLLDTQNRQLVEHTKNDGIWGDNGDGTGYNNLGQLLMKLRDSIRNNDFRFDSKWKFPNEIKPYSLHIEEFDVKFIYPNTSSK